MSSRRRFLVFAAALAASPALAQAPGPVRVALTTAEGVIVLELYPDKAPITVANFLRYVEARKYDGAEFYRASRPPGATDADYGLLQGGIRNPEVAQFPAIAHEPTTKTGLSHTDGTIALGRFAPGTAKSDFFICVGDQSYLDANPKASGDNQGFAAFGKVVEGMETVKKILALPVDPNKGTGAMKGEILKAPVRIVTARRM
ncbi:peptidylprolyl isomerase [Phenylobacterium sp.]|jgi:peptidyl-prolyl cis-trans isomerase A (cyclophilin A)|uniref:peptidylprolyl isomerase n=1 Tax=Phenylobacterium sp. TaxID=1871053 RepID=UPI0039C8C711